MVAKADSQDKLRDWIEEKRGDTSIRELARQAGLSHVTITQFLNRERNAGLTFCLGMAKAFKTSPVVVLSIAGIIPPLDADDLSFRELWHHVRKLPYRDRVRLIQIASQWSKEAEETEEKEE